MSDNYFWDVIIMTIVPEPFNALALVVGVFIIVLVETEKGNWKEWCVYVSLDHNLTTIKGNQLCCHHEHSW